ncbi:MAG TPA: NAD(P)H-hydrate dehydratase [Lacipirellulaceae bacterium]|nr:NAD(P)H-hydrate dehydratase [Lacipirellulaceae bacterium]
MPSNTLCDLTDTPLPLLPQRAPDSHKGNFGRAVLIGGSRGMSGAIAMAGKSTLRSGAGLVTLAVPRCVQDVVASIEPSYMTHGLTDTEGYIADSAADPALALTVSATAVALGPGIGRSRGTANFVERLYREVIQPMVVDADALFALAERPAALSGARAARILTPHPGEFERLTGTLPEKQHRTEAAAQFAAKINEPGASAATSSTPQKNETIVVLKGHNTVVTDGCQFSINHTGNPGMATGGSGDVLTGIIAALLCQGLTPFDAARLGVHVHGLAGDLAAEEIGQVSMIASDLIDYLPKAFGAVVS